MGLSVCIVRVNTVYIDTVDTIQEFYGPDSTAWTSRLNWAFILCICPKDTFLHGTFLLYFDNFITDPFPSKNCTVGKREYQPGQRWLLENCTDCVCKQDGVAVCLPITCPVLPCQVMVKKEGLCCPVCLSMFYIVYLAHLSQGLKASYCDPSLAMVNDVVHLYSHPQFL